MSVQALISSCASEEPPREMEREDVGRDAPGWVVQGGFCPAASQFSRMAWALMTLWPCQQHPKVSLWFVELRTGSAEGYSCGQWGGFSRALLPPCELLRVRTCGRGSTNLVTLAAGCLLGICLMPFFQVDFKILFLLPSGSFLCMWNKLLEPFVFNFTSPLWPMVPVALSTHLCSLGFSGRYSPNVNSSNSSFCVCLISKTSSVLFQRQWWAVLSLPVFSGHGCSALAQYQGFCHEEAPRVSLLKAMVATAVLSFC